MNRIGILKLTMLMILMLSAKVSLAVQDADTTQELDQEEESVQVEQQNTEMPEQEETTDEEIEESPSRFLPTEQISQDLGVTFPADI